VPPKNCPHAGAVDDGTFQIDGSGLAQRRKQKSVELGPHRKARPIGKPSPTRAAAAAAHFGRQVLPRNSRFQNEYNPRQRRSMLDSWATAFGRPRRQWGQQWFDLFPQFIRHKLRHAYASLLYATAE
jgi:hypothetical protein